MSSCLLCAVKALIRWLGRCTQQRNNKASPGQVWVSNAHLAWKVLHKAERLTVCQNRPFAVVMVTHTGTDRHTHTCAPRGCLLNVQSSIMDVVL